MYMRMFAFPLVLATNMVVVGHGNLEFSTHRNQEWPGLGTSGRVRRNVVVIENVDQKSE